MCDGELPSNARAALAQDGLGALAVLERTPPFAEQVSGRAAGNADEAKRQRIPQPLGELLCHLTDVVGAAPCPRAARYRAVRHFDRQGARNAKWFAGAQSEQQMPRLKIACANIVDNAESD